MVDCIEFSMVVEVVLFEVFVFIVDFDVYFEWIGVVKLVEVFACGVGGWVK